MFLPWPEVVGVCVGGIPVTDTHPPRCYAFPTAAGSSTRIYLSFRSHQNLPAHNLFFLVLASWSFLVKELFLPRSE